MRSAAAWCTNDGAARSVRRPAGDLRSQARGRRLRAPVPQQRGEPRPVLRCEPGDRDDDAELVRRDGTRLARGWTAGVGEPTRGLPARPLPAAAAAGAHRDRGPRGRARATAAPQRAVQGPARSARAREPDRGGDRAERPPDQARELGRDVARSTDRLGPPGGAAARRPAGRRARHADHGRGLRRQAARSRTPGADPRADGRGPRAPGQAADRSAVHRRPALAARRDPRQATHRGPEATRGRAADPPGARRQDVAARQDPRYRAPPEPRRPDERERLRILRESGVRRVVRRDPVDPRDHGEDRIMGKGRLEAFSDGVLTIIITIMVLELRVPEGVTLDALAPVCPKFFAYAVSFVYVGIYWNNHHHLLHTVKKVDGWVMWGNMLLLFWLSLVPFTAGWIGESL